jgi:hypothetical protein
MIQFPELDLKNTKIRIILFFLAMLFLFISNFSTNNLLSIVVILLLINQFSEVKEKIDNHVIKKQEKIAVRYNNKIDDLLQKIKKFRKFSPQSYKSGYHFWKRFIQEITILENQELHNYNHHFDKAHYYLQKSINSFHSIGVAVSEEKYIDALEFHEFTNSKRLKEISRLSKELYSEGYHILHELSLRYNKQWIKNPSIHNKEIVIDYPLPHDREKDRYYDFFL